jgi:hypothetical protein
VWSNAYEVSLMNVPKAEPAPFPIATLKDLSSCTPTSSTPDLKAAAVVSWAWRVARACTCVWEEGGRRRTGQRAGRWLHAARCGVACRAVSPACLVCVARPRHATGHLLRPRAWRRRQQYQRQHHQQCGPQQRHQRCQRQQRQQRQQHQRHQRRQREQRR